MLSRCLFCLSGGDKLIPSLVRAAQREPVYLRRAPPTRYFTCTPPPRARRHLTRFLKNDNDDGKGRGVFAVSSTALTDLHFEEETTLSTVLIGLPEVHSEDNAARFVEVNARALQGLHLVVLPEVHPSAGEALRAIRRRFPQLRIAGGSFARAFLSDATFFDGVRRAIRENATGAKEIVFAEVDNEEGWVELVDGLSLSIEKAREEKETGGEGGGCLQVYSVPSHPLREESRHSARRFRHQPPHFDQQHFFFYDPAFEAMHVGASAGWLPWLPQILTESRAAWIFPLPPLMAAEQREEDGLLLEVWRVREAAESFAQALRKVPSIQYVLAAGYGELPGDVEEVITSLDHTAGELEKLRSRLARRLETDTGRDLPKWSALLLEKVVKELGCGNRVRDPTSAEVWNGFLRWAAEDDLGRLCRVLTRAAMSLPPTEPTESETPQVGSPADSVKPPLPKRVVDVENDEELEGPQGVVLMQSIFSKKGLQSLNRIVRKEEIDVRVFLAMKQEDFTRVFKTTFGLSKRLERLQVELKEKIPPSKS